MTLLALSCTVESFEKITVKDWMSETVYSPLIIAIMLKIFRQFEGISTILSFASRILTQADFKGANSTEIVVAVIQVVSSLLSCVLIDRLNRRSLYIFTCLLMGISLAALGCSFYFLHLPKSLTLIAMCVYILSFATGVGPLTYLLPTELLPTRVRGAASAIAIEINYLSAFVVVNLYTKMESKLHSYGCFWIYAVVCLISAIFVYYAIPETKGKTLEEIEEWFMEKSTKRNILK